jgi:hypothetical protein
MFWLIFETGRCPECSNDARAALSQPYDAADLERMPNKALGTGLSKPMVSPKIWQMFMHILIVGGPFDGRKCRGACESLARHHLRAPIQTR